jgi:hypothetical protein
MKPEKKPAARPLMAAVASQQKSLETLREENSRLRHAVEAIARYAGLTQVVADVLNPASPVPDPASAPAFQSTEDALAAATHDDPRNLGAVPGGNQGVPAESTTTALEPGTSIDTQPFNQLIDVTAPTAGTETHVPNDQTRIETDVRVGNPDNPEVAFPLQGPFAGEAGTGAAAPDRRAASRTFNSIKLARLRKAAGVEQGEELEIAGRIETEASLSDEMIEHEIEILSKVRTTASARPAANRNLVPRTAGVQRTVPSLAPSQEGLGQTVAAVGDHDTMDADLFMD